MSGLTFDQIRAMRKVTAKLGTMRKPRNWLPQKRSDGLICIQADGAIGILDPLTGKGRLTTKGGYFPHLAIARPFEFPPQFVADVIAAVADAPVAVTVIPIQTTCGACAQIGTNAARSLAHAPSCTAAPLRNREGLTWEEWRAAAAAWGAAQAASWQRAWEEGEDPTEYARGEVASWAVTDMEALSPSGQRPVLGRFATQEQAAAWIDQQEPAKVERGGYGLDGPEVAPC